MDLSAGEKAIKEYLESEKLPCTENVPRTLYLAVNVFLKDLIRRVDHGQGELSPRDIADVIEEVPEYDFLKQLIPQITGSSQAE